jgi:pyruvate/2-oxoglutarate dehydrogenase complex dihydrolipoamide dehydrogenase (E3) component
MRHDLVVIGAGSAGLAAATFAARMGARVAVIEADRPGGDCTWTGCVPSKALIHAAGVVHGGRTSGFLPSCGPVDFDAVREHVVRARERVFDFETPAQLAAQGIEVVAGRARFVGAGGVDVDGTRVEARRFVICTGASPVVPPIPGLAGAEYLTYETVFDLDRLPPRLLVVGGGPTGSELAQAFARLGSRVTIVEAAPRLAPVADPEAAGVLDRRFRREGIQLLLGTAIERVEGVPGGSVAALAGGRRIEVDRLLLTVGRRPRVDDLGLDAAGVAVGPDGIHVDERLRTSVRHIYAAGDVTGAPQFTHYAVWQGFAAARNALFPGSTRGRREPVPWTIFTEPEIAQIGLSEAEARLRDARSEVHRWPAERIDRAQTEGETDGFIKLITTRGQKRILGATIVSARAGDVANQAAIAIEAGMGLSELTRIIQVYPTYGYGVVQLAGEARMQSTRGSLLVRMLRRLWRE